MEKKAVLFLLIYILSLNLVFAETYTLEFNQVGNKLIVNESINDVQTRSYVDTESLDSAGQGIYFLNKVVFPKNFEKAKIILNLEKGVIVKNKEIFPLGYNIESDGQTISIYWELTSVEEGNAFAIFVNLEDTSKSYSYFFVFLFILLVLALFIFSRKKKFSKKPAVKVKKEKIKSSGDYDYLLDTEKKIIEDLKKANRNELWQKQVQISTGFSKAKVSRLIRNLESRGLVKKIPFGNTNKIRLK